MFPTPDAEVLSGYPKPRHDAHEALYELLSRVQLRPAEIARASECQNEVRARLRSTLRGVKHDYLSGSYGRKTAITPLHDIDVVVVLDRLARSTLWDGAPHKTLQAVLSALKYSFPYNELKLQNRSVRITRRSIQVDLVPAFESDEEGLLLIPDRRASKWLLTDPGSIIDESPRLNQINAKLLKPIVKLLKKWRDIWSIPLRSFHLEMMVYSLRNFQRNEIDYALFHAFSHLCQAVCSPCQDPANAHINLGDYLSLNKRAEVAKGLQAALVQIDNAISHAEAGNLILANNHWKKVFKEAYPRAYWR